MRKLAIAIDFDRTICVSKFPKLGVLRNGCKDIINKWHALGHTIIINTCRVGYYEDEAARYLDENGINFHYINENCPERVKHFNNSDPRKIGADLYIDDKDSRQLVDWDFEDKVVMKLANSVPTIIAIIGESGTGKTTLAEHIERQFSIVMVESHTDRAKRHPNETGHTFHTKEEFCKLKRENMIAYTQFGDKRYCCLKSDLEDINTYVIDERGLNMLDRKAYNVIAIRAYCPKKVLKNRITPERAARDKGMFTFFHPWLLKLSKYDYCIRTDQSKEKTKKKLDKIIKEIISKI